MSKKSRKRNKRILGALGALGLGLALANRGKGTEMSNISVDSGRGSGLRPTVDDKVVTGTRFPGENKRVVVPPKKPKFNAKDLTKMNSANVQRGTVPPPGIFSMGKVRFKKPMDLSIKPKFKGSAEVQREVLRAKKDAKRNDMLRAIRSTQDIATTPDSILQGMDPLMLSAKKGGRIVKGKKTAVRKVGIAKRGFGRAMKRSK